MNFGGWVPLHEAPTAAPETPGVLQARADALLSYPKGKSAMVLYARCSVDDTLRHHVAAGAGPALARAAAIGARWVRFGASPTPDLEFSRVMQRFVERFGAKPAANEGDGDGEAPGEAEEARSVDG